MEPWLCEGADTETRDHERLYTAVALPLATDCLDRWVKTLTTQRRQPKIVSYLSAEFLLGPHLGNAMINLGIYEQVGER